MGSYDVTARKAHQWTMVALVALGVVLGSPWPLGLAGAILLAPAALIALAGFAVRVWNGRRLRRLLAADNPAPFWDSLGETPDGRPTLVTFSAPSCAACRSAQAPAVSAVEQQLGAAEI